MKKFFAAFIILLVSLACTTSSFFATPTPAPTPTPVPVGRDLNVPLPPGDPARGEMLFNGQVNGQYPCYACHGLYEGQISTCPNIVGVAARAAERIPGYSAEQYLRESIVSPDAYVVADFPSGIMPQDFAEKMTAQDLADLIAFLMTE